MFVKWCCIIFLKGSGVIGLDNFRVRYKIIKWERKWKWKGKGINYFTKNWYVGSINKENISWKLIIWQRIIKKRYWNKII